MYDAQIGRWHVVDPMADITEVFTPYHFVRNNPINRIDPTGLTDFKINKDTGSVEQVGKSNDDPDRVLKTDKDGNIKRKGEGFLGFLVNEENRGKAKVAFGGIEKGILEHGQNFKTGGNLFAVGGEGQPSEQGVEAFALKLSSYVGKEIGGAYFGTSENTTHVSLGGYANNQFKKTQGHGHALGIGKGLSLTGFFHTHPSGPNINDSDRLVPSGQDKESRDNALRSMPSLRFYLLTAPDYGGRYPRKIEYTTGY